MMKSRKNEIGAPSKEERTRAEIMETAASLFQRYGLRKTSLDDIARAMGKRRSFLYYYYESKEDLLKSVAENEIANMMASTHALVAQQATVEDKIRVFFVGPLRQTQDRMKVFSLLSDELRAGDGQELLLLRTMRHSFHKKECALLAKIVRGGVASGEFQPLSDSVIESFASFAVSARHGIELDMVMGDGDHDPLENLDEVVDVFLRGFRV